MSDAAGWQPLLSGSAQHAAALAAVRARTAALAAGVARLTEPRRLVEHTLLFTWASEVDELALDLDLAALATGCLSRRLDELGSDGGIAALFGGVAGVAWTLARLVDPVDGVDPCAAILDALAALTTDPAQARDYDLIGGLVGFGVAGLERLDTAAGQRLTRAVLDGLVAASPSWWTPAELLPAWKRAETPHGRCVLGVGHGVAGVIAYLALLVDARFDDPRLRPLLDGAVAHLLAAAPPDPAGRFPPWLPAGEHRTRGRLAWCTGELGIAATLLLAADATGHAGWRGEAIALARAAATRSVAESGVHDAGFCHGAAGVAHLFNRLAQATGDAVLRAAAKRWYAHLVAMPPTEVDDHPGMTTGSVGITLALLAAISPVEPGWDRLFLIA